MRVVLQWAKNNLVILISAFLCIGSLGFLVYIHSKGNDFVADLSGVDKQIASIGNLLKTNVTIPPEQPDGEPRKFPLAVNPAAIDALRTAYRKMDDEYRNIFNYAVSLNSKDHLPMVDGLFPEPSRAGAALAFDARARYKNSFDEMLGKYSPTAGYPQIDARAVMTPDSLIEKMRAVEDEYRSKHFIQNPVAGLPAAEVEMVRGLKSKEYMKTIREHAEKGHIYAVIDPTANEFPFDVGEWARGIKLPTSEELWGGQMGLWIQQDIARAIALTNRVDKSDSNVLNMPVKRLLRIQIVPGYVGVHGNRGGMQMEGPTEGRLNASSFVPAAGAVRPTAPAAGAAVKLPNDFATSPTGRASNSLYDVVHVWVKVIIDVQRMPEFFDNLSQVNFMTVLKMEVRDVDEYKALEQGYVYGTGDCVEATMLIETVWLRDWTAKLMPAEIRKDLGISDPAAPAPR
ncbi:MAG: hypothetical protein K8S99_08560 [Planctomycetes bacterium]|nr:hypothetical protein [Planctomycetota bacterium]